MKNKRFISWILVLSILMSSLGAPVFAESPKLGDQKEERVGDTIKVYEYEKTGETPATTKIVEKWIPPHKEMQNVEKWVDDQPEKTERVFSHWDFEPQPDRVWYEDESYTVSEKRTRTIPGYDRVVKDIDPGHYKTETYTIPGYTRRVKDIEPGYYKTSTYTTGGYYKWVRDYDGDTLRRYKVWVPKKTHTRRTWVPEKTVWRTVTIPSKTATRRVWVPEKVNRYTVHIPARTETYYVDVEKTRRVRRSSSRPDKKIARYKTVTTPATKKKITVREPVMVDGYMDRKSVPVPPQPIYDWVLKSTTTVQKSTAVMPDGSEVNVEIVNGQTRFKDGSRPEGAIIKTNGGYYKIVNGKGVLVTEEDYNNLNKKDERPPTPLPTPKPASLWDKDGMTGDWWTDQTKMSQAIALLKGDISKAGGTLQLDGDTHKEKIRFLQHLLGRTTDGNFSITMFSPVSSTSGILGTTMRYNLGKINSSDIDTFVKYRMAKDTESKGSLLGVLEFALGFLGFMPGPIGTAADLIQTGLDLAQKNWFNAVLSGVALVGSSIGNAFKGFAKTIMDLPLGNAQAKEAATQAMALLKGLPDFSDIGTFFARVMTDIGTALGKAVNAITDGLGAFLSTRAKNKLAQWSADFATNWSNVKTFVKGKIDELVEKIDNLVKGTSNLIDLDVVRPLLKTEPNGAFFWSGKYINEAGEAVGVMDDAARIAKSNGGNTLETMIEAKGIQMPEWDINNPASIKAWEDVSAAYANQVSGEVKAVIGSQLREGNIWENVELPRLKANPNVTKIITIDPVTMIETIIFER